MHTEESQHLKTHSKNIMETLGSTLRIGVEDTLRTIEFSDHGKSNSKNAHHIGPDLDKYEERLIKKRKIITE